MIKIDVLDMIDVEFEEFENDRNRRKNIKHLVNFSHDIGDYNKKEIEFSKPKFKKEITTKVYIKNSKNNNKNKLF